MGLFFENGKQMDKSMREILEKVERGVWYGFWGENGLDTLHTV